MMIRKSLAVACIAVALLDARATLLQLLMYLCVYAACFTVCLYMLGVKNGQWLY
jgi:hypothetical protein